jgi:uncharacterized membrane protein YoaK (UPF0700 family)
MRGTADLLRNHPGQRKADNVAVCAPARVYQCIVLKGERIVSVTVEAGSARATEARAWWPGVLDGFIAGYSDTLGFVALGLFTAHVTGNLVVLGSTVAHDEPGLLAKLMAFPMFVIGVAVTRHFALRAARRQHSLGKTLHWAEALLLTGFMLAGALGPRPLDIESPLALLTGMLGVMAMSVHNARNRMGGGIPNTVMTGNVTQLVMDLVDLLNTGGEEVKGPRRRRARQIARQVVAFVAGAACGAAGYLWLGFWALGLPVAALVLLPARFTEPL